MEHMKLRDVGAQSPTNLKDIDFALCIEKSLESIEQDVSNYFRSLKRKIDIECEKVLEYMESLNVKENEVFFAEEKIALLKENKNNSEKLVETLVDKIKYLKHSSTESKANLSKLQKEENLLSKKCIEEKKKLSERLEVYKEKWRDRYETRYSKNPLIQHKEKGERELADLKERLQLLKSELRECQAAVFKAKCERNRRNAEENRLYPLKSFIIGIAKIWLDTKRMNLQSTEICKSISDLKAYIALAKQKKMIQYGQKSIKEINIEKNAATQNVTPVPSYKSATNEILFQQAHSVVENTHASVINTPPANSGIQTKLFQSNISEMSIPVQRKMTVENSTLPQRNTISENIPPQRNTVTENSTPSQRNDVIKNSIPSQRNTAIENSIPPQRISKEEVGKTQMFSWIKGLKLYQPKFLSEEKETKTGSDSLVLNSRDLSIDAQQDKGRINFLPHRPDINLQQYRSGINIQQDVTAVIQQNNHENNNSEKTNLSLDLLTQFREGNDTRISCGRSQADELQKNSTEDTRKSDENTMKNTNYPTSSDKTQSKYFSSICSNTNVSNPKQESFKNKLIYDADMTIPQGRQNQLCRNINTQQEPVNISSQKLSNISCSNNEEMNLPKENIEYDTLNIPQQVKLSQNQITYSEKEIGKDSQSYMECQDSIAEDPNDSTPMDIDCEEKTDGLKNNELTSSHIQNDITKDIEISQSNVEERNMPTSSANETGENIAITQSNLPPSNSSSSSLLHYFSPLSNEYTSKSGASNPTTPGLGKPIDSPATNKSAENIMPAISPFDYEKHLQSLKEMAKSPDFTYTSRLMYKPPNTTEEKQEAIPQNSRNQLFNNQPSMSMSYFNTIPSTANPEINSAIPEQNFEENEEDFLTTAYAGYLDDSPPMERSGTEKQMFSFGRNSPETSRISGDFFPLFGTANTDLDKSTENKGSFFLNFGSDNKIKSPEETTAFKFHF